MSIKSIKEKELLVNFARAMGQAVDPKLAEEVDRINAIRASVRASVSENIFKDLGAAVSTTKSAPIYVAEVTMPDPGPGYDMDDGPLTEDQLEQIQETVVPEINFPVPPSLDELLLVLNEQIEEVKNELVQAQPEKESPETEAPVPSTPSLADRTSDFLSKSKDSFQQPDPLVVSSNMDAITKKLRFLEQWVSKISMAGSGSGEVNLRYLDDVERNTISDGLYLRYNAPTKKFIFDHGHQNAFYGAFQSTETQTCNVSTANALTYNQIDFAYGVTVANDSQVVIEHPGLYNAQFSVQLTNSGTQIDPVYIWLRQNGQDVIGSTGKIDVPSSHGGVPGAILIGWNFYINTLSPNEYFEFMWFTPDTNHITIPTLPAQNPVANVSPYIPSTASVVLTVSPVKIN